MVEHVGLNAIPNISRNEDTLLRKPKVICYCFLCGVIVHHLMVQVNSDIDTYLCHCHSHCVMVRSDIVIDRDINLASVRATS